MLYNAKLHCQVSRMDFSSYNGKNEMVFSSLELSGFHKSPFNIFPFKCYNIYTVYTTNSVSVTRDSLYKFDNAKEVLTLFHNHSFFIKKVSLTLCETFLYSGLKE